MYKNLFFLIGHAATAIYTLSLHDALPISVIPVMVDLFLAAGDTVTVLARAQCAHGGEMRRIQRRGTEFWLKLVAEWSKIGRAHGLNSSHPSISYAVFCLKQKTSPQHIILS